MIRAAHFVTDPDAVLLAGSFCGAIAAMVDNLVDPG
jgi:hypothetical protein